MKIRTLRGMLPTLFLVLILILSGGCSRRPFESGDPVDTFSQYLNNRIPRLMERYGVPGVSLALVSGDKPVWSGAYGYADAEQGRRMTVDAICRAESISKSVTAWGVMKLVEQGRIDLDSPVERYFGDWKLPDSRYPEEEVTVRRLLSHNAGMPMGTIGEEYPPQSAMPSLRENLAREARLIREPGSGFLYSNPGFNLLELVIEEVTGRDFAEYMKEEVLIPLGMQGADYAWKESLRDTLPTGYELGGAPVPPYVYPANASGGLFADVEDIARFAAAGMTGPNAGENAALARESIRTIHSPQTEIPGLFGFVADAYGFGHFIESLPDGRKAVWHGGQGHGWMTHFHCVPESGDGIVILTNSQRSWPFIAAVLADWARWSGLGSVRFGRITSAAAGLSVLIGIVVLLTLWRVLRWAYALRTGRRRFAPFCGTFLFRRLAQASLSAGVIAVLAWAMAQPYLFVSSIFPGTAGWAGGALLFAALFGILSALFPRVED